MKKILFLISIFFILGFRSLPGRNASEIPAVFSPISGEVLKGIVYIQGNSNVEGFRSIEISFAYENELENETWFLIEYSEEPVTDSVLAVWDTTLITDGDYQLKVKFTFEERDEFIINIRNIKVRNYSSHSEIIPTEVQSEIIVGDLEEISDEETFEAPIELAENPVVIGYDDFQKKLFQGLGLTGFVIITLIIYLSIRSTRQGQG